MSTVSVQGLLKQWRAAWFRKITVIIQVTKGMILKTHNYDLDNWSLWKIQLMVVMKEENNGGKPKWGRYMLLQ